MEKMKFYKKLIKTNLYRDIIFDWIVKLVK